MSQSAILFPGQGAQYVGMGAANHERFASARQIYEEAASILDFDIREISFNGPAEELSRTDFSQPAIFVASVASLAAYGSTGGQFGNPVGVAGLSLGEYTALYYAGVLEFGPALELVALRGKLMQEVCEDEISGMVSILGLDVDAVRALCDEIRGGEVLEVANLNGPKQIVISGHIAALKRAEALAPERGARKIVPLQVAGAFHSPVMEEAEDELRLAIEETPMSPPNVPVLSNVGATPLSSVDQIREALVRQLTAPVLWHATMSSLQASGAQAYYEVGPGRVLSGLAKRFDRSAEIHSIDQVEIAEGAQQ